MAPSRVVHWPWMRQSWLLPELPWNNTPHRRRYTTKAGLDALPAVLEDWRDDDALATFTTANDTSPPTNQPWAHWPQTLKPSRSSLYSDDAVRISGAVRKAAIANLASTILREGRCPRHSMITHVLTYNENFFLCRLLHSVNKKVRREQVLDVNTTTGFPDSPASPEPNQFCVSA